MPITAAGDLSLPAEIRAEFGLSGAGEVELDVQDHTVVLRLVDYLTPDEEEHVRRARADFGAGRYRSDVTEEELLRLIGQE